MDLKTAAALRRLRLTSAPEAVSFLILLVCSVLKRTTDFNAVPLMGSVHGVIFVLWVVLWILAWYRARWTARPGRPAAAPGGAAHRRLLRRPDARPRVRGGRRGGPRGRRPGRADGAGHHGVIAADSGGHLG